MVVLNYQNHHKAKPFEAIAFRVASRYEPALEGLTQAWVSKGFIKEREKARERGIPALVRSAMARFEEGNGAKKWEYTHLHSIEAARFGYIMAREAKEHSLQEAEGLDPKLVFAGLLIHDVGKTFIPMAIVVKELGIDFGLFTAFKGSSLTDTEKRIMRELHVANGMRYVQLFGDGDHIRKVLDIVYFHHVMYNGLDSGAPSYPAFYKGKDLSIYARLAKGADFISAVKPRHYRTNGYVHSIEDALAYAVTVCDTEIDPIVIKCFITGYYEASMAEADTLVRRLAHPDGQEGVSDINKARAYAKNVVRTDPMFIDIVARENVKKRQLYDTEMLAYFKEFSLHHTHALKLINMNNLL